MGLKIHDELIVLIKKCPVFYPILSEEAIINLAPHFTKKQLKVNEVLFTQGDMTDNVYILTNGQLHGVVSVSVNETKMIGIINPFETIGELSVVLREPRSLTVVAKTNAELLTLPGHIFMKICEENNFFTMHILHLVAKRSMKTIDLFSRKNKLECVVFLPANDSFPIKNFCDIFFEKIDLKTIEILWQNESLITTLVGLSKDHEFNKLIFMVLKKFNSHEMEFIKNQKTRFFLLAEEHDRNINYSIQEILNFIRKEKEIRKELLLLHPDNINLPTCSKFWFVKENFHLYHHIRWHNHADYQRLIRFIKGKAIGLVLSGGGIRCFAHVGVIQTLQEQNIPIDIIGGASGGSIVAASYALTKNYMQCMNIYSEIISAIHNSVSFKNITWPLASIFSGYPGLDTGRKLFDDVQIENLWIPYFCISCNLSTNSEHIHTIGDVVTALQCTTAIPGVWPPALVNGQLHFDGGILNNLPVDVMRNIVGEEGIVIASRVSNLAKNEVSYSFPPVIKLKDAILYKIGMSRQNYKFPDFIESFLDAILLASSYKEVENSAIANVLIRPHMEDFGTFRLAKNQTKEMLITRGYEAAQLVCKNIVECCSDKE